MRTVYVAASLMLLLVSGGLKGADPNAEKQAPFEIRGVQRATKKTAYVEDSWQRNVPCIEASIRTTEDLGDKHPYVRAYFFNRDKQVVSKYDKPAQAGDTVGGSATRLPEYLKPKEYYKVYFPVIERAREGKDRWARVIVVVGEGQRAVADIYPADDITGYDFPEKNFALYKVAKAGGGTKIQ